VRENEAVVLMVEFADYSGPSCSDTLANIVPIGAERMGQEIQLPVKLAWGMTIHKAQGLTLPKVTVDIGEREIASGLSFVAFSRVRKIADLRVAPFTLTRITNLHEDYKLKRRKKEFARLERLKAEVEEEVEEANN
jgi:ATP-dependent exoDNAse (exonuclease V) alpha subunit